jgi:hypothetical protein
MWRTELRNSLPALTHFYIFASLNFASFNFKSLNFAGFNFACINSLEINLSPNQIQRVLQSIYIGRTLVQHATTTTSHFPARGYVWKKQGGSGMNFKRIASHAANGARMGLVSIALLQFAVLLLLAVPIPTPRLRSSTLS